MKTIAIKNAEVKTDLTASGNLIDKVALALGEWTEEDLYTNNADYSREGQDYELDHFNFDKALLAYLNKQGEDGETIAEVFKSIEKFDDAAKFSGQPLKLGAFIALNYPKEYAAMLAEFEEEMREEAPNFYDSEAMAKKCPELVKDLQKGEDFFWENLRHEWLHGDRSSSGLLGTIRKHWQAASVDYNTKADTLTLVINDEEAAELLDGERVTLKNLKAYIINDIETGQEYEANKQKEEAAKRRAERERVAEYRKQRDAEEAAERRAELEKMTK